MRSHGLLTLGLLFVLVTGGGASAAFADDAEAISALRAAIGSNNTAQARAAILAGADANADLGEGRTPLTLAVMFSRPEIVKLLLDAGADTNHGAEGAIGNAVTAAFFAMNGTQLTGDADEFDASKHATAVEVLKLVASTKCNLNLLVRRGLTRKTALMIAAEAGMDDAVQVLLDAGADVNVANDGRYTALDYAVDRGPSWSKATAQNRVAIVRALLAKGARKDRKPADGVVPAERAKRAGYPEVAALLAAH